MRFKEVPFLLSLLMYFGASAYESPCEPLMLSSHRWAQNITFTPNSVFKVRCPLINTRDHCGIVNLVEWLRSETRSGDRVPVQTAYLIDPLTFYFQNPSERDSGWYTCVVGNNVGVTELSTYISFKGFEENTDTRSVPLPLRSRPTSSVVQRVPIPPSNPTETESTTTIDDYLYFIQSQLTSNVRRTPVTAAPQRPILSKPIPMRTTHESRSKTTNFDWGQGSSSSAQYSPQEGDHLKMSASSSNTQSLNSNPSFENKKWNRGYKDEDLSEHLQYMYERMAKLEGMIQSLQTRMDLCERLNSHDGPVGRY